MGLIAWPALLLWPLWIDYHACEGHPCGLWQDTVRKSPLKARPRINLARAYQERALREYLDGRLDDARIYQDRSLEEYSNALIIAESAFVTQRERRIVRQFAAMNVSQILLSRRDFFGAEKMLVQVWNEEPGFPGIANNLAIVYIEQERLQMAGEILDMGIQHIPAYPSFRDGGKLHLLRSYVHSTQGECSLAMTELHLAKRYDADLANEEIECMESPR